MKYIKTYEKFELNENWISQALDWIKEKLSSSGRKVRQSRKQMDDYVE